MTNTLKVFFALLVIITIASVAVALNLNAKITDMKTTPIQQVTADDQMKKIIADVSQHIILPTDETPTMAVVSDLSKLAGQPFFERSALGDIVLVYANARRAVLWRPTAGKIIEVSAINFPSTVGQTTPVGVKTTTPAPVKK